jgi:hypothetical protein
MNCGPSKTVQLELYNTQISDFSFSAKISNNLGMVEIFVSAEIEGDTGAIKLEIILDGQTINEETTLCVNGLAKTVFSIQNPQL